MSRTGEFCELGSVIVWLDPSPASTDHSLGRYRGQTTRTGSFVPTNETSSRCHECSLKKSHSPTESIRIKLVSLPARVNLGVKFGVFDESGGHTNKEVETVEIECIRGCVVSIHDIIGSILGLRSVGDYPSWSRRELSHRT
jgi:hypothetical protein